HRVRATILDQRRGLFLDGGDNHLCALGAGRIQQQQRKTAVSGNQAKFFGGNHLQQFTSAPIYATPRASNVYLRHLNQRVNNINGRPSGEQEFRAVQEAPPQRISSP